MTQSSVEWLQDKLNSVKPTQFCSIETIQEWVEQAKQMEKDVHDEWNRFLELEKELGISDAKTVERIQWYYNQYVNTSYNAEQYYNETFNNGKETEQR